MHLIHALRFASDPRNQTHPPRVAFVGAGGKTTTVFQLGRQLAERWGTAVVTATTHLGTWQLAYADHQFTVQTPDDLLQFEKELPSGVVLFTGPVETLNTGIDRTAGLQGAALEKILALAGAHQAPLLVEADGSRQLPLKAPAEHEPALPSWADHVVVVVGLSGAGQPLTSQWVHRPERFAQLSGLRPGEPVTPEALSRVLSSPDGGLKRVPPAARRIALLNQADTPIRQGQAQRLASLLQETYHAILVASLAKPDDAAVSAVYERTAGIVLAAGSSSRIGRPKQLLEWRGEPFVRRAASTALEAGLSPVLVITGAYAPEVEAALRGLPVAILRNEAWEEGQSASVVKAVQSLPPEVGSAIFLLVDQPQVSPPLLRSLAALHSQNLAPITAPQAGGRRANPVLFDRVTFPDLMRLSGDTGGRSLFSRYPISWLPWHDEGLLFDVDTLEDYRRLVDIYG